MGSLRHFALGLALAAWPAGAAHAEIVDRIVASVGKQIVTLSDAQEEYRVQCFLEGKALGVPDNARIREIAGRLVDQALLRQEMQGGSFPHVAPETIQAQMEEIRRRFPDQAAYRKALESYGLEEDVLRRHLQLQADAQEFIEHRFRPGAQVTAEEIERYYRQELLPELRKQHAREPALEEVREQITALLVERHINEQWAAWMKDLRSQAEVHMR